LEEAIDRNIAAFVDFIDRNYIPTPAVFNPFDFGRKAQYLTLDVISDIAFGKSFGDVQSDSDVHQYIEVSGKSLPIIILVTVLPWLNTILQSRLFKSFLPSDKDKLGLGRIIGYGVEA
jgi:hypothetical protein